LKIGSKVKLLSQTGGSLIAAAVAEVIGEVTLELGRWWKTGMAFAYRKFLWAIATKKAYLAMPEFRATGGRNGVWKVLAGINQAWESPTQ